MINRPRLRKTPPGAQRAIMAHRLFPVAVAVWGAALFGLGSLAASADALGALVAHLHLPAVLPAAAPPLGMTARLMLAIAFAGLGGAIGLAIGVVLFVRAGGKLPERKVSAPISTADPDWASQPSLRVRNRDAHPDAPPRRPLVVTEDVLPYPTAIVEAPAEPEALAGIGQTDRPFDPASEPADLPPFLAAALTAVSNHQAPIVVAPAEPIIVPALSDMPETETIEPEPVVARAPPPLASVAAAGPKVPLDALPLASLGLVQLIERLALAIAARQAHRAAAAQRHQPDPVDASAPLHRFDPLSMDPTGPLLRAKKSRGEIDATVAEPATQMHDPLSAITDRDNAPEPDLSLARFLAVTVAQVDPDAAVTEYRYSSLADMALPRPELMPFVATGDEQAADDDVDHRESHPVVPFRSRGSGHDASGQSMPAGDADRALREALATLRQMSAQR